MHAAEIMARLIEIEKAVGKGDPALIHSLLMKVEEGILHLEQLTIEALRENIVLRQQMEHSTHPSWLANQPFDA
jgi:hypothetical protein